MVWGAAFAGFFAATVLPQVYAMVRGNPRTHAKYEVIRRSRSVLLCVVGLRAVPLCLLSASATGVLRKHCIRQNPRAVMKKGYERVAAPCWDFPGTQNHTALPNAVGAAGAKAAVCNEFK